MRLLIFILGIHQLSYGQPITTESFTENRWVLNSSINLPAVKFHIAKEYTEGELREGDKVKGYLELFSSFGVGLSLNYGKATFKRNVDTEDLIPEETIFSNLVGLQFGVLYSSKLNEAAQNNVNEFSLYGGINLLDLQLGVGYELGAQYALSTRWFVSIAYGIPIYKLTGRGSHVFKKRKVIPQLVQPNMLLAKL